jgi:hypothetical protein
MLLQLSAMSLEDRQMSRHSGSRTASKVRSRTMHPKRPYSCVEEPGITINRIPPFNEDDYPSASDCRAAIAISPFADVEMEGNLKTNSMPRTKKIVQTLHYQLKEPENMKRRRIASIDKIGKQRQHGSHNPDAVRHDRGAEIRPAHSSTERIRIPHFRQIVQLR